METAPINPPRYRFAGTVPKIIRRDPQDVTIWRYVDLAKFVQLLDRQALWFCRTDRLGDPFEGAINAARLEARAARERMDRKRGRPGKLHPHVRELVVSKYLNAIVNCWHMNNFESAAMWTLYGRHGVALRSTRNRLIASLPPPNNEPESTDIGSIVGYRHKWLDIEVHPVEYIDYKRAEPMGDPLLCKRKDFEHERELRVIARDRSGRGDPMPTRFPAGGAYVPVKLNRLVDAVLISPEAPPWLAEVVTSLIERYGFKFSLERSGLSEKPNF